MKKLRYIILSIALFLITVFTAGCYVVQAQPTKNVKGTYKLTHYTATYKAKNSSGVVTTTTTDRLTENEMEVYLVITGYSTGYCYYKNKNGAYAYEIRLGYLANEEDSSKFDYVLLNNNNSSTSDIKLAVTQNGLNFSRIPMYVEIFGQSSSTYGYDINLQKVDNATNMSYVTQTVGTDFKQYTLSNYNLWGGYSVYYSVEEVLTQPAEGENPIYITNFRTPYKYHYIYMDPATQQAKSYSMLYASNEMKVEALSLTPTNNNWTTIKIGDEEWTQSASSNNAFERKFEMDYDGIKLLVKAEMQLFCSQECEEYLLEQIEYNKDIEESANFAPYQSQFDTTIRGTYKLTTDEIVSYEIIDGVATEKTDNKLVNETYLYINGSNIGHIFYKEGDTVYRYEVEIHLNKDTKTNTSKNKYWSLSFKRAIDTEADFENIFSITYEALTYYKPALHFDGMVLEGCETVWTKVDHSYINYNYILEQFGLGIGDTIVNLDEVKDETPEENEGTGGSGESGTESEVPPTENS